MAENNVNLHDFVERRDVETVLQKDRGMEAILKSFKVEDFTTAGDNMVCLVTRVIVTYCLRGNLEETTYVVKIDPRRGLPSEILNTFFDKEIGFYEEILPLMNAKLVGSGEDELRLPKYFHSVNKIDKKIIYLSDLRVAGFKMTSRYENLDESHTILIVKELARFHAASHLLLSEDQFKSDKHKNFLKKFPYAVTFDDIEFENFDMDQYNSSQMENVAKLVDGMPEYDYVVKFLRERKESFFADVKHTCKPKEPFTVLCHGDCWNNNFLFRYGVPDTEGTPIDCRILDFQNYKITSGSVDLNHFLFTSVCSKYRREKMQSILDSYYASFQSVLRGQKTPMPFSKAFLKEDFHAHNNFGMLMTSRVVPLVLLKPEDAPNLSDFTGDESGERVRKYGEIVNKKMRNSPLMKPRLLDTYEELRDYGVFSSA